MRQGLAALNTQRQVLCSYRDQYERKLPGWLADRAQHRAALATLTQAFEQLDQQRVTLETARNACIELKLRLESDASGLAQRRAAVTVVGFGSRRSRCAAPGAAISGSAGRCL